MSLSPIRDKKRARSESPVYSSVSEEGRYRNEQISERKSSKHKEKKSKKSKTHKSEKRHKSSHRTEKEQPLPSQNGAQLNGKPQNGQQQNGAVVNGARKEPLSLSELLKKKQEQSMLDSKPVFMTKKQREEVREKEEKEQAAKQLQEKQIEKQRQQEDARTQRERDRALDQQMEDERRDRHRGNRYGDEGDRYGERERERYGGERDRYGGERERPGEERERNGGEQVGAEGDAKEKQRELELIKQQYLGMDRQKRKIVKPSEKFRFNFDWDIAEDTSRDLNPIYNRLHEPVLLFGRGYFAGTDRKDQRLQQAKHEKELLEKIKENSKDKKNKKHHKDKKTKDKDKDKEKDKKKGEFRDLDVFKDTNWRSKSLKDMTERDWRIFREDYNIAYKGHNTTNPMRNWKEGSIPDKVMKAIKEIGYQKPSPIQMAAIPLGLQQKDVIGIAETGSGKTAAFVIPMLSYIMNQPPMTAANEADGPYAIVMAPTRELSQQIEEETIKIARFTNYRVASVVGGQSIEEQGVKLRKGCEMVIATPGRLIDCLERRYAVLNQCNYLVLDEADKMIEMGFEQQVIGVLDAMPSTNLKPENENIELEANRVYRTTYMFSATMPPPVERLAKKYLRRPVTVVIGTVGRATDNVSQRVHMVKENEKASRLQTELGFQNESKYIVFVNTRHQCDFVYRILSDEGYQCTVLHGGRTQDQREQSIKGFREDVYNILIATDVAGRGIDVPDVGMVINYDMPKNVEMYTHRIGRTGRAGKKGIALTFLTLGDTEVFYDLKKLLDDCNQPIPSELLRHEASKSKPGAFENKAKRDEIVYAKN